MSATTEAAENVKKAASSSVQEVEETVSRIASHKGVEAVMIVSLQGEIIQSTFQPEQQVEQAKILVKVQKLAASLFSDGEEISFIRIRTTHHEMLVSPNNDYLLVVLHNPLVSTVEQAI